ncbi:piezo-type mechanosensitive ion channel component [Anaeramoeba flamelloides]|uniref:Piezo-type mechanosensitive ion channel component n=1 Tax=Anaeramoeba flamelloides TaxID=1746091 RepID=A0ABQ8XTX6_9EUKA|nr:piezo-type mechanosensitive ion channel component [Anaeramoeba flamelloides]
MTFSASSATLTSGSLNSELSIRSPSNSEHTSSDELQPKKEILIYQNQLKEQQHLKKIEDMKEDQLKPKSKANKWLILFLVFLLPISLFICFTTRFNALSGLYFLFFIVYLFVPNHSYTRGVKKFQNFHFAYLTLLVIFSSLVLIGQIIFNSYLYHNEKNGKTIIEENSDTYEIYETIGLQMFVLIF